MNRVIISSAFRKSGRIAVVAFLVFVSLTVVPTTAQASTTYANIPAGNYYRYPDEAVVKPAYLTCQWKNNSAGTAISIRCKAVTNSISDVYGVNTMAIICGTSSCRTVTLPPVNQTLIYTDNTWHTVNNNVAVSGSVAGAKIEWVAG